jgi:hypothetical protein
VFRQHGEQRCEILRLHLQKGRRLAVRQHFNLINDRVVLRRKGKGASQGQVQNSADVTCGWLTVPRPRR